MAWIQIAKNLQIYSIMASSGKTLGYVTESIWFDYRRTGNNMQYRFKTTVSVPSNSYYNNPLNQTISLDRGLVDTHTIKGRTTKWGWSVSYETGWFTVYNKIRGTTALALRVYDTAMSSWVNYTFAYNLPIIPKPPTAPTWTGISANPCEVNTPFILTWGGATAGTNSIKYDIVARAYNGSYWTDWARLSTAYNGTSFNLSAPKNLSIAGVKGNVGVKYQYAIRSNDTYGNVSAWTNTAEQSLSFISPTSPTNLVLTPTKSVKKNGVLKIDWSGANGGSGSITNYNIGYRLYNKKTKTWTDWTETTTTSTNLSLIPIELYPDVSNGDSIQVQITTVNNWGFTSATPALSPSVSVSGAQITISDGSKWIEGETTYISITNSAWLEADSIYIVTDDGKWHESE